MYTKFGDTLVAIVDALKAANGRRKIRTLGIDDVIFVMFEALHDNYGFKRGGYVANNYGYPAVTTAAICGAVDGRVVLGIGTTDAKKTCCPRPAYLAERIPRIHPDGPAVRQSIVRWAMNPDPEDLVIARKTARKLVADWLREQRKSR